MQNVDTTALLASIGITILLFVIIFVIIYYCRKQEDN